MIIISASMPRSASRWYRNLTVDILKASGYANPDMKTIFDAMDRPVPRNVSQLGLRAMKQLWTANEIHRLAAYLEIALSEKQIEEILAKYTTDNTGKIKDDFWRPGGGYLKNKGKIGRYKEKLSDAEQALCNQRLHRCLSMMGYK